MTANLIPKDWRKSHSRISGDTVVSCPVAFVQCAGSIRELMRGRHRVFVWMVDGVNGSVIAHVPRRYRSGVTTSGAFGVHNRMSYRSSIAGTMAWKSETTGWPRDLYSGPGGGRYSGPGGGAYTSPSGGLYTSPGEGLTQVPVVVPIAVRQVVRCCVTGRQSRSY